MNNFWKNYKSPIIGLAPMDGVTDYPTRKIQTSIYKPDVIYTEFINTDAAIYSPESIENHLKFDESERPIVAQVFGSNHGNFEKVVKKIVNKKFDGIDINMGCPAPKILSLGAGASLIKNPTEAGKIITAVAECLNKQSSEIPLSVKTRILPDDKENAQWFKFLSTFPISEVTIHGRPVEQNHSGSVDWNKIRKSATILRSKDILCLGNGGITSPTQGRKISNKYELDGILIGQAALGNPWVFMDGYIPTQKERFKTMLEHCKLAEKLYGPKGFISIRKHLAWYCKGFSGAKELRKQLVQVNNVEDVERILDLH